MDTSISPTRPTLGNQILRALPADEIRRLRPHLTRVRLVNGAILHHANERVDQIYFVEQGFVSMVAIADGADSRVEVGLIGREGVVGALVLLAPEAQSYAQAMVQMPGTAHRIPSATLLASLEQTPTLRDLMLQAFVASLAQLTQTAACNSRHNVRQRLARWLLMAQDRVDGDEVPLTQEFLAIMLAVRRPGITVAVGGLQAAGLVQHGRGRIMICDRPGLEEAACACYDRVRKFIAVLTS